MAASAHLSVGGDQVRAVLVMVPHRVQIDAQPVNDHRMEASAGSRIPVDRLRRCFERLTDQDWAHSRLAAFSHR